jgi:nitrogen regulatory protein PII
MMILVTAVIKPHALDAVREALSHVGIAGMTISEVQGFGRQRGHTEVYRGAEYKVEYVPKVKVEVLTSTEMADDVVEAITKAARTGKIGDGKIWTTTVDNVTRIRTGETGPGAI